MTSFMNLSLTRKSDESMKEDENDDSKRKTRNLSEKKRRDQFNVLISELSTLVSSNSRKMDKSTVLKTTISFLRNHNDNAVQSRVNEIHEDWKPSFLSNEEFTHLFLEALDGFIIVFSSSGRILFASESITSLLGYFPNDLLSMTLYDIVYQQDHHDLYNIFMNPAIDFETNDETELCFTCHCRRGGADMKDEPTYEVVQFLGSFRSDMDSVIENDGYGYLDNDTQWVFVGTGRLQTPQLIRELSVIDSSKCEFTSRHSLEWKFLFLDHRAPPIIGYLPFEVLGTSGYDYYHIDDLDKVVTCHEALMQKGEGTSCYYRFLTKGQQWIWLQTRFYITYHQWNSKPEFVVCTHRVVSFLNVLKPANDYDSYEEEPTKSEKNHSSKRMKREKRGNSDTNSLSADSPASRQSHLTSLSSQSKPGKVSSTVKSNNKSLTSEHTGYSQAFTVVEVPQPVLAAIPTQRVDLLEKRQEELQQKILEQQTELRQVTEQLLMAKYGLFPPVINVSLPYAAVNLPNPELFVGHASRPILPLEAIQHHDPQVYPYHPGILYDPSVPSPNSTHSTHNSH